MNMNYFTWSREYYRDAEKLLKHIRKLEEELKTANKLNLEEINSTIASYRYIYYDVLNTAKLLEERARKATDAA